MKNKMTFKVGDVEYAVVRPSVKVQQEAQRVYNRVWAEEVKNGSLLRQQIDQLLRERNLWDDAKESRRLELLTALRDGEKKLREGGMKLSEGRSLALQMRRDRNELNDLDSDRSELDNVTAEGTADNARFDYLVSQCTVDNAKGQKVFASYDDFLAKKGEELASRAAGSLMMLLYGLDDNFVKNLPENAWLKSFKFVDDNGHLINKEGKKIDAAGRLVDDDGRFINEAGEFINAAGERVDADGKPLVEAKPWLDEEGNPIVQTTPVMSTGEFVVQK